ncbi:multicopper oxidase family protein [Paraburkholderia sp. SARCC-3016]|uniref:multicopper oxidase family protein n=1 Tax=Paraburkholderia sp. SARCC-3016 TaxID=3058611 RepID=UPI0028069D1D|nr:multicopper oxidase family protein [Paraburkholderia sp. SARCC-3016]MDQ7979552.1 multicopper oxidase family protein [Paraburkholderia sp. SARCC-3016]
MLNRQRRNFLALLGRTGKAALLPGVLNITAAEVVAGSAVLSSSVEAQPRPGDTLIEPPQIRSKNGTLETTLTAAKGEVRLGSFSFPGRMYNGEYIPPVLRVRLDDTLKIRFNNRLPDEPSNLHFHGMSVSPRGHSDNVFVHVPPGGSFDYQVNIPANDRQGPGMFWYHPHAHGVVTPQILGGMSGGLVVEGMDERFPVLKGMPERLLFIKHVEHEGREVVSINGQINPVVSIRAGELQYWRIAHIGATLFMKFALDGLPFYVVATDGHVLSRPRRITEFFMGPGQRYDIIFVGPPAGEYAMRTISFQNEAWVPPEPAQQLMTVVSSGPAVQYSPIEDHLLGQQVRGPRWIDDVRGAAIARRRTLDYSRTPDRKMFMIDGRTMDENRVDQTVRLGDTEEWTIVNTDQQFHSFHIHQTAFLVTEVNGVAQSRDSLHDTYSTPPATDLGPGSLKVVIPFTDPVIVGRFVYHCHSVNHEDKGMMGIVEVVDGRGPTGPDGPAMSDM